MSRGVFVFCIILGAVSCLAIGAAIGSLSIFYTKDQASLKSLVPNEEIHAECVLVAASDQGDVGGLIIFHQMEGEVFVAVEGNVTGLDQGLHGFHIHTYGILGGDCAAAEGHYNPDGFVHGAPSAPQRHVGDLGNIQSGEDGIANVNIIDEVISLYGERSVVGRSVVVHAGEDDLGLGGDEGSLTTGNAGARVACCTIFLTPH